VGRAEVPPTSDARARLLDALGRRRLRQELAKGATRADLHVREARLQKRLQPTRARLDNLPVALR
jgi:hypothetical protein